MNSDFKFRDVVDLTPDRVAELMPGRQLLPPEISRTQTLVLQRFHLPPSRISLPEVRDNLVVIHLRGQVFVEEELERGKTQRRWSEQNQISITPAGERVTRVLKGRPDILVVHLPVRLIQEVGSQVWNVDPAKVALQQCLAEPNDRVSQIGRTLQAEAEHPTDGSGFMTELLGRALALNLLRDHSSLSKAVEAKPQEMAPGRLSRVLRHMEEHLAESMSLEYLAALSGLSPTHFARSFRNSTGQSPHRYLTALRVEHARKMLESTSNTVLEIGLTCGFNQSNHFSYTFRKHTGLSPRAWRTESRK